MIQERLPICYFGSDQNEKSEKIPPGQLGSCHQGPKYPEEHFKHRYFPLFHGNLLQTGASTN